MQSIGAYTHVFNECSVQLWIPMKRMYRTDRSHFNVYLLLLYGRWRYISFFCSLFLCHSHASERSLPLSHLCTQQTMENRDCSVGPLSYTKHKECDWRQHSSRIFSVLCAHRADVCLYTKEINIRLYNHTRTQPHQHTHTYSYTSIGLHRHT